MTLEEFKRVTEVTYLGFVYGTLAALKRMLPRDRGVIIQVGSAPGLSRHSIASRLLREQARHPGFLRFAPLRVDPRQEQCPPNDNPDAGAEHAQFGWVKSRLPRKAQPVPPIYQPEVAARAILYASHHPRREIYVGLPTVEAIVGNKIAPGTLDHYLARTCFDAQMRPNEPGDPNRPDNLWKPVDADEDHGAHGVVGARARTWSPQLWTDLHRGWVALGILGLAGAILGGFFASQRLSD